MPLELSTEELKNWLKLICTSVGCCVGMIEVDTGEAAGRPCTLCGESTSNSVTSAAVKRPSVSTVLIFKLNVAVIKWKKSKIVCLIRTRGNKF